jgi:hypothetical protein
MSKTPRAASSSWSLRAYARLHGSRVGPRAPRDPDGTPRRVRGSLQSCMEPLLLGPCCRVVRVPIILCVFVRALSWWKRRCASGSCACTRCAEELELDREALACRDAAAAAKTLCYSMKLQRQESGASICLDPCVFLSHPCVFRFNFFSIVFDTRRVLPVPFHVSRADKGWH